MGQTWSEFFPPKPRFSIEQVTDQTGKVFVITGGTSGIGKEVCRVLLSKGATVYLTARAEARGKEAIDELRTKTGVPADRAQLLILDLGDLKQVKEAADELKGKLSRLDCLILNAGVMHPPGGSKSVDGYELSWATNVLGHHLFVKCLLPLLISTAAAGKELSPPAGTVRVVHVSSLHQSSPKHGVDFDRLEKGSSGGSEKWQEYPESKLGNLLLSLYMAKHYKAQGVASFALNPGNINTGLLRHHDEGLITKLIRLIVHPLPMGALTPIYAATSPDLTLDKTGAFLIPWARVGKIQHEKANEEMAEKVWTWCDAAEAKVFGA